MAGSLLLSVPQAHRIEADVVTCCSLINALERGGQWLLAEKLFLQMCTTQEDGNGGPCTPPGTPPTPTCPVALLPIGSKLLRAQTSPSSVLDTLQSPPGRTQLVGLPLCSPLSCLVCQFHALLKGMFC
jgi:pentatricopeptide repeat protein